MKDKHKEKKHKKEKSDKGKREGKEKKDKDRSKDKHKEKKDRKERHKDKKKKDKDKDKLKTPYDRADKQTDSPNGDMLGECSRKAEAIKHSKSTEELGRKIKDGDKVPANWKVDNFSGPVEKSIGSFAVPAVFKERVPTDKIIPSSAGAPQGRIDGLERSADKIAISNQRRNEILVSSHVSQKERSTSDKLAPDLNSTAQRGNGGSALPLEKQVGSCPRTNPSSHLCEENGRTLESSHIATVFPSVKPEAIRCTLMVKPVDNKEHKINGIAEAQPSLSGLTHPVAAKKGAAGKVNTSPHLDSMYLSQVYSLPKVDEWPEYDDQEWLFSSCHLPQKPKSKLGGNEVPQVWSEALKIEQEDVVALPYVVPY
ncbi:hypothetical protein BHM03_00027049 [Ensete ventricosum]|nr:hypothetical protein BHM03_00027049 [Ensete ventricosum]